jgi:hypothetical protein
MDFYEVINTPYANQILVSNGLLVALYESEWTDLITEGLPFLMCAEGSIMRLNSSTLELDFTAYTWDFIRTRR